MIEIKGSFSICRSEEGVTYCYDFEQLKSILDLSGSKGSPMVTNKEERKSDGGNKDV